VSWSDPLVTLFVSQQFSTLPPTLTVTLPI
jgi:hypothetical protein